MVDVLELHEAAMELVDKADNISTQEESIMLLAQAYELEKEAAFELVESIHMSDLRSVVYSKAIQLGIRLGRIQEAQTLAQYVERGYIHPDFNNEIRHYQNQLLTINTD